MTTINLIDCYKITPTEQSIKNAVIYHDYDFLLDDWDKYVDEIAWDQFANLGLVEVLIEGDISDEEINNISPDGQAVYMEFFMDEKGISTIEYEQRNGTQIKRLCFFLHFIDFSQPLIIMGQSFELKGFSSLPERLEQFTHYVPVD